MKNAFNSNLPKANPKLKSAVSVMASPLPSESEEPKEREPRASVEAPPRRAAPSVPPPRSTPPSMPAPRSSRMRVPTKPPDNHRSWFSMIGELEGHVSRALEARSRTRIEVDDARTVLARTADAAAEALHQLAAVEKQLIDRSAMLTSLLEEMDELKHNRSDAINLARKLSRLDRGLA